MPKNRVVVLDVDLTCHKCNKKIKNVLGKYKDTWGIEAITYDEKGGKVKLSGPFDPEDLVKKLCRKACEVIRKWCIKKPDTDQRKPSASTQTETIEPESSSPMKQTDDPSTIPGPTKPEGPTCYPWLYPYPVPVYLPACSGKKRSCSCGGRCTCQHPCGCGCGGRGGCQHPCGCGCGGRGGCQHPCGCGCGGRGGGCFRPYHPLTLAYDKPCYWVCEEEATGCAVM